MGLNKTRSKEPRFLLMRVDVSADVSWLSKAEGVSNGCLGLFLFEEGRRDGVGGLLRAAGGFARELNSLFANRPNETAVPWQGGHSGLAGYSQGPRFVVTSTQRDDLCETVDMTGWLGNGAGVDREWLFSRMAELFPAGFQRLPDLPLPVKPADVFLACLSMSHERALEGLEAADNGSPKGMSL